MNEYEECIGCSLNDDPTQPGSCDDCVDGRYIEAVCKYASTCDGCGELVSHENMEMDPETQLGYCEVCVAENRIPPEILQRLMH
jgi:hypothetical protein